MYSSGISFLLATFVNKKKNFTSCNAVVWEFALVFLRTAGSYRLTNDYFSDLSWLNLRRKQTVAIELDTVVMVCIWKRTSFGLFRCLLWLQPWSFKRSWSSFLFCCFVVFSGWCQGSIIRINVCGFPVSSWPLFLSSCILCTGSCRCCLDRPSWQEIEETLWFRGSRQAEGL